jgi:hypothetical protein
VYWTGATAFTSVVKVAETAVDVSPALPPNSIRYGFRLVHGRSFHRPLAPLQLVTAQSAPGLRSLFGSLRLHDE